jgi:sulfatase maturation enzyme AslB (radical SAM superfamily)
MHKYKLTPQNTKLINIDSNLSLLFHADSLQIYPVDNKELLDFLEKFIRCSITELSKLFSENDIKAYKKFIINTINNAPKSLTWQFDNENLQVSYDSIVLPISAKCNLACPYCFATNDGGYKFSDFNENSIKKIANFAVEKRKDKGATSIIFFGGEPLLNFNCIKFTVEYFKQNFPELPVGYSLTTNGTILNDEIVTLFKENNFAVLVSLDGADNEFNLRKYKNGKSSVPDVLKNIENLKAANLHLELRATLVNTNTHICETYEFFEKLQLPFSIVFAYTSENKAHCLSVYNEDNLQIIK